MNQPILGPSHSRRVSRSNSTTSSVATVQNYHHQPSKGSVRTSDFLDRPATSNPLPGAQQIPKSSSSTTPLQRLDVTTVGSNMNINRWSQSSTSSTPVPEDYLSHNTITSKPLFDSRDRGFNGMVTKPQYSVSKQDRPTTAGRSPQKSPQQLRNPRNTSPTAIARAFYTSTESNPIRDISANTSGAGMGSTQDYFAGQWEHRAGVNKYGQPVQGVAVQYITSTSRVKETDTTRSNGSNGVAPSANHVALQKRSSHKRYRDDPTNGSRDQTKGSGSSVRSDRSRRGHRSPTQKSMLSRALEKANAAVLEDNAQNFHGAIEAYIEACELLQQVMQRSADMDDRKKLENIHATYSNRIAELHDLDDSFGYLVNKELPDYPPSQTNTYSNTEEDENDGEDAELEEDEEDYSDEAQIHVASESLPFRVQPSLPPRQESLLPQIFGGSEFTDPNLNQGGLHPSSSSSNLRPPMQAQYMPPPLSPRRPPTPPVEEIRHPPAQELELDLNKTTEQVPTSTGSTSWLDTFDESASSRSSSRLSSFDFGAQGGQLVSEIEAEFDALNKTSEVAYDSEPSQGATPRQGEPSAKADDSNAGTEASTTEATHKYDYLTQEYLDSEAEEEEELLELMMQDGFGLEFTKADKTVKPAIPRQSDSSGFSGRSSGRGWESSIASTAATSGTTLSTLAETLETAPPKVPPPQVPGHSISSSKSSVIVPVQTHTNVEKHVGLRDRRLSGQGSRQLKIETFAKRTSSSQQQRNVQQGPVTAHPSLEIPPTQLVDLKTNASGTSLPNLGLPLTPLASASGDSLPGDSPATPALQPQVIAANQDDGTHVPPSPSRLAKMMPPPPRKNISSSSLRPKNLSVTTSDVHDLPATPGSALFSSDLKRTPSTATPAVTTPSSTVLTSITTGGMYLFDDITMPSSPINARSTYIVDPMPLESCPISFMLRPFWLMRCLYQVLTHPKGGYLSNKLFIPRDVWRVKNVKLKALDDKIAQCDMLTAALLKLAKVDTLDADAVLEELQSFELILDQARSGLQKKLGSDVGVAGTASAFKSSPAADDSESHSGKGSGNSAARSIASSWRKLRSKSSSATLSAGNQLPRGEVPANLTMPSLPMTDDAAPATSRSHRSNRHPPPTPSAVPHIPAQHTNYMSSMARLFDSVQVLDAIARQVEDPGLKATNTTQVGLEFSIRNAAEFFAFFIIRFALADIGLLIDKYLKRGTEWAMA